MSTESKDREDAFDPRPKVKKERPKPRFQTALPARLRMAVGSYYRQQALRIAMSNGIKMLRRDYPSYGKAEYEADEETFVKPLLAQEQVFGRLIGNMIKDIPIAIWIISTVKGMAGNFTAQLIGLIGDISHYSSVAKLWAFAGMRPDQRRRKGEKSNWNADLKRLMYNIGISLLKAGGYYASYYDWYKAKLERHTQAFYHRLFDQLGKDHEVVERLQAELELARQISDYNSREKAKAKLEGNKPKLKIMKWGRFQGATLDAAIAMGFPKPKRRDFFALKDAINYLTRELGFVSKMQTPDGEASVLSTPAITPAHRHMRAIRKMEKIFLEHIFVKWRELEGLPVIRPWIFTHGGHDQVNYVLPPVDKDSIFDPNQSITLLRDTGS